MFYSTIHEQKMAGETKVADQGLVKETACAIVGKLSKKHQEKHLGVEMEEYLPPGSSAVVAIVDDVWADKVDAALVNSDKRINKAIDKGDYDELQKAIDQSSDEISDAVSS